MTASWGDLVARVRGLRARWGLGPRVSGLDRAEDLAAVRSLLLQVSYPVETPVSAAGVEAAVLAVASAWRRVLARWAGPRRRRLLAVLFEEETVRALERFARGALEGSPVRERLAGCLGGPPDEMRLGQRLAELGSIEEIAAALRERDHPYAEALSAEGIALRPDPWALGFELQRSFLRRAIRGAASADLPARRHVALVIDHRNLWTALLLAREPRGVEAQGLFVPGGRRLGPGSFRRALALDGEDPRPFLAACFPGSRLAAALREGRPLSILEDSAATDRFEAMRRWFRLLPVSSAGVLAADLELDREHRRIRGVAWRLELAGTTARAA